MNYKDACNKARAESLKDGCTKYVKCQIIPSMADPAGPLHDHGDYPTINREAFFTTDWYSGAVVARYDNGKWMGVR